MQSFIFWVFAVLMIVFGAGVALFRSPMASALSLVVSFVFLAGIFTFNLDAYFIGVIQVLVYAGAVMVLFLFIIMLLDLRSESKVLFSPVAWLGGALVFAGFVAVLFRVCVGSPFSSMVKPSLIHAPIKDDAVAIGLVIFRNFNFPLQIIGVLLLVATVGVVVLSKRELK